MSEIDNEKYRAYLAAKALLAEVGYECVEAGSMSTLRAELDAAKAENARLIEDMRVVRKFINDDCPNAAIAWIDAVFSDEK